MTNVAELIHVLLNCLLDLSSGTMQESVLAAENPLQDASRVFTLPGYWQVSLSHYITYALCAEGTTAGL
jgi:hypothetical protein